MSNAMLSLFVAAGVATFAYTKLGRRVGYGNTKQVWIIVAVTFIFTYAFLFSLLKWVLGF
jgi:low affinity Fe/Cu permease